MQFSIKSLADLYSIYLYKDKMEYWGNKWAAVSQQHYRIKEQPCQSKGVVVETSGTRERTIVIQSVDPGADEHSRSSNVVNTSALLLWYW